MDLLERIRQVLAPSASESAQLAKIRVASERRRSAKSSALNPRVEGDVLEQTAGVLSRRVESGRTKDERNA